MAAIGIRVLRFMGYSDVLCNMRICLYCSYTHWWWIDIVYGFLPPLHNVTLRFIPCMQVSDTPLAAGVAFRDIHVENFFRPVKQELLACGASQYFQQVSRVLVYGSLPRLNSCDGVSVVYQA